MTKITNVGRVQSGAAREVPDNEDPSRGLPKRYQIDLPLALRLASAENYQIKLAEERIREAHAQLAQARILLLPRLTAGLSYYRLDGSNQNSTGNVFDANFTSGQVGLGVWNVPGVTLNVDLADAIFEPLVARQDKIAAEARSHAVANNVFLSVTVAYQELLRAKAALAIAGETYQNILDLARLTKNFAETGEGLTSDAERVAVEQLLREKEREEAWEEFQVRSARLVELLQLDAGMVLEPVDTVVLPIQVVPAGQGLEDLISTALQNRPEVKQNQALVNLAEQRLNQVKYGPLIPRVALGFSAGNFGGGTGSSLSNFEDRFDFGAMVYWQLDGLGFGNWAQARERRSRYQQAQLAQKGILEQVASEVKQANARIQSRNKQMGLAGSAVDHALRSFELNRTRIHEKQGLPIEVLQAIQSLATARRLYLDTVIDYNQAQVQLYTALGQPAVEAFSGATSTPLEIQVMPAKSGS